MSEKNNNQNEEYAHEFGVYHSVQESDAKIDLTKFLLSKKKESKPAEKSKSKKEENDHLDI
ncbi:hypothetical protein [Halalkalibacter akibai]|nr:hypothetical protein [Halalkalibacter akibai]